MSIPKKLHDVVSLGYRGCPWVWTEGHGIREYIPYSSIDYRYMTNGKMRWNEYGLTHRVLAPPPCKYVCTRVEVTLVPPFILFEIPCPIIKIYIIYMPFINYIYKDRNAFIKHIHIHISALIKIERTLMCKHRFGFNVKSRK